VRGKAHPNYGGSLKEDLVMIEIYALCCYCAMTAHDNAIMSIA